MAELFAMNKVCALQDCMARSGAADCRAARTSTGIHDCAACNTVAAREFDVADGGETEMRSPPTTTAVLLLI